MPTGGHEKCKRMANRSAHVVSDGVPLMDELEMLNRWERFIEMVAQCMPLNVFFWLSKSDGVVFQIIPFHEEQISRWRLN